MGAKAIKLGSCDKHPAYCKDVNVNVWYMGNGINVMVYFYFSTFSGATSHYFGLAHSFWAMCFVANTYAVIIHHNKVVFKHPIKIHLMQSVLCWLVPAIIVASCLCFAPPGYKFFFMDLMTVGAASMRMAYFAMTLPMQVTLGASLCLLWSIVWHLRKVTGIIIKD